MRTFIISDLHGNGDIYDSVMGYLDKMSADEKVELYINGDLIDRGLDTYRMFFDVIERINGKGNVKIHYLGGNHELMMYQAMFKKKDKPLPFYNAWILNGGRLLEQEYLDSVFPIMPHSEVHSFLGDLKIYHLFDEVIDGKKLLLVHAQAPKIVNKNCELSIKDNNFTVDRAVWTREESDFGRPFFNKLGKDGYLTIIGHTPVDANNKLGYFFKKDWVNIDGGCAAYACGLFNNQYVPLVEVRDGSLRILTFNHNNEILFETIFDGKNITYVQDGLHKEEREKYLDHRFDNQSERYQKIISSHINK